MAFSYPKLKVNDKATEVDELRKKLNLYFDFVEEGTLKASDNKFTKDMEKALKEFQTNEDLVVTKVTDKPTWLALRGEDTVVDFSDSVPPRRQLTNSTCWKASVAMLYNILETQVNTTDVKTSADGGVNLEASNLDTFAARMGLTRKPCVINATGLAALMRAHGAMMLQVDDDFYGKTMGNDDAHFVVLVKLRTDALGNSDNSTVTIFDPWGTKTGVRLVAPFKDLIAQCRNLYYKNDSGKMYSFIKSKFE
jgi:hypothetical protein